MEIGSRRTLTEMKTDPKLLKLIEDAKKLPPMTAEEREAQRRSWVIGELMLEHADMTREEALRLYNEIPPL